MHSPHAFDASTYEVWTPLLRGGTVGSQMPVLYASVIPVNPGDVLIFVSDLHLMDGTAGAHHVEPPVEA